MLDSAPYFIENNEKYYLGEEVLRKTLKTVYLNMASTISAMHQGSITLKAPQFMLSSSTTSAPINITQIPINLNSNHEETYHWEKWKITDIYDTADLYIITAQSVEKVKQPHAAKIMLSKVDGDINSPNFKKLGDPGNIIKEII